MWYDFERSYWTRWAQYMNTMPRSHIFNSSPHKFCAEWKFDRFGLGQHFIPFINVSTEFSSVLCFFCDCFFEAQKQKRCVVSFCLLFLPRLPAVQIVHNTWLVPTKYTCVFWRWIPFFTCSFLVRFFWLRYTNGMHSNPYPYHCLN